MMMGYSAGSKTMMLSLSLSQRWDIALWIFECCYSSLSTSPFTSQPVPGHQGIQLLYNPLSTDIHTKQNTKKEFASPVSVLSPKYGSIHKVTLYFCGLNGFLDSYCVFG